MGRAAQISAVGWREVPGTACTCGSDVQPSLQVGPYARNASMRARGNAGLAQQGRREAGQNVCRQAVDCVRQLRIISEHDRW